MAIDINLVYIQFISAIDVNLFGEASDNKGGLTQI